MSAQIIDNFISERVSDMEKEFEEVKKGFENDYAKLLSSGSTPLQIAEITDNAERQLSELRHCISALQAH